MIGQRKIGVILQYCLIAVNTLVGILYTPYLVHTLGNAEYGLYQLVASVAGYLAILDFGIGTTVTRYVNVFKSKGDKQGEENYLFMSLVQTLLFSFAVLLLGGICYFLLDDLFNGSLTVDELKKAKVLYILMVINIAISLIDHFFWGTHTANERFVYNTGEKIIRVFVRVILIIVLLELGMDSIALIAVDLFVTSTMLICDACYSFGVLKIRIKYHFWDNSMFKESFIFAFFIFLQAIINQITINTDKVILGVMTNTIIVAIYSVSMQIFTIFNSLSTAIQSVFLPKTTRLVQSTSDNSEITSFVSGPARIQFMLLGLVLIGFFIVGKDFVVCWMGEDYIAAYYIALIVMVPSIIELSENVIICVVLAKNKNGFRTGILACIAVMNIILTILFVKLYGYMGAPIATAISYILGHIIVVNIYYYKVIGINILELARHVLRGTLPALIITLLLSWALFKVEVSHSWLMVGIKSLSIVGIYSICMIGFGLNKAEKSTLKTLIRSRLNLHE